MSDIDNELKRQLQDARMEIEVIRDFIEWLFDTELDYTTFREKWDEFENLDNNDELNKTKQP